MSPNEVSLWSSFSPKLVDLDKIDLLKKPESQNCPLFSRNSRMVPELAQISWKPQKGGIFA